MKPKKEWFIRVQREDPDAGALFGGVMFHDAMEHFIQRECPDMRDKDALCLMNTHGSDGEEFDCLENWCSVPYEDFKQYLDLGTPFDDFHAKVKVYLDERIMELKEHMERYIMKQKNDTSEGSFKRKKVKK